MSKTTILYKDIAPGASDDAVFSSENASVFSTLSLADGYHSSPAITGELNECGLDGTFEPFSGTAPFWSSELSGADCKFLSNPVIEIVFDSQYSSVGLTLFFHEASGGFCSSVNIKWYQGTVLKAEGDFSPDRSVYFCEKRASSFNRVVLTLSETSLPYKFAKLDQIVFGVYRTFDMTEIRNAKITNQCSLISSEIPVSTLDWTLDSRSNVDFMFQFKQPMEAYSSENLIGVYYVEEHSRAGRNLYNIRCQDAFGVLDASPFAGGVYSNQSAMQLIEYIIDGDFAVSYSTEIEDTNLTGAILPCTKREALQQVFFAWGVCASTDGQNGIRIFRQGSAAKTIGESKTFPGTTTDVAAIVTQVRVTAHTYTQDNAGSIVIGDVKYNDTTTVYTVSNPDVNANDKKNVIEVTGATLVSNSIGQAVAQRVYDYYTRRNTNRAKIVWSGELLGDCVTIPNALGETATGHLLSEEITLSNTVAADCEVLQ